MLLVLSESILLHGSFFALLSLACVLQVLPDVETALRRESKNQMQAVPIWEQKQQNTFYLKEEGCE